MSLTTEEILAIAKLARINLSEEEVTQYQGELNNILDWVDQLQKVDTDGVPQFTSVNERKLPMRDDVVTEGNLQQEVLANAPDSQYGCFVVPKMVE